MIPDFLYHYTSIETLALILDGKKIRFNRLDKVDDKTETEAGDLKNYGRFSFVSCWTNSHEESIPLWSMYTPGMKGVRLKVPTNMFRRYTITEGRVGKTIFPTTFESVLPYERIHGSNYLVISTFSNPNMNPEEVIYTDNGSLLNPQIMSKENDMISFDQKTFGRYKKKEWFFQSEWRFILTIYPSLGPESANSPEFPRNFISKIYHGIHNESLPFDDFYLDIEQSILADIEVTLGPKCTSAEKIIVESLLNKYSVSAHVVSSALSGDIR